MKKYIKECAALTLAAALSDVGNSFAGIPTYNRCDFKSYGYHKKNVKVVQTLIIAK